MRQAHAATYPAFGRRERDDREPRPAHPDTLLRNHFEVEGTRALAANATPITKLSTDWRSAVIRLAIVGGVFGQARVWTAWQDVAALIVVALAAWVLWTLGKTEGNFARALAVLVAVAGFAIVGRGL